MNLVQFLSSNNGRLLRALLGAGLAVYGLLVLSTPLSLILAVVGGLVYLGALLDLCLLGLIKNRSVLGATIRGDVNKKRALGIDIAIAVLGIGAGALILVPTLTKEQDTVSNTVPEIVSSVAETPPQAEDMNSQSVTANTLSQEDMLLYLIEEEKLAHDVYARMYELYGEKVFGNILKSESTHQSKVLTLLQARELSDPRSSEVGVFINEDLQALYNQLIAQGSISTDEAFRVGVAIEEKDIADITTQLGTAVDSDIITTLESLRTGSENHLRAFNRQLGRY